MSEHEDSGGGGGGGGATRLGGGTGSRVNLLKPSRLWGTGRSTRIYEEGSTTPTDALEADAADGTPTKSVKFMLARKRTDGGAGGLAVGAAGNRGGSGDAAVSNSSGLAVVTAKTAGGASGSVGGKEHAGGNGKAGGEAEDPRAAVMNVTVQTRLWADYFNNTVRCWEALLDPFRCGTATTVVWIVDAR